MLGARTFDGAAAAFMISTLSVSPALATPGSGFTPAPIVNGHFNTLNVNSSKDSAIHNVTSAGGAEFVAIVIKPEGFVGPAFRLDRAKANNCNF